MGFDKVPVLISRLCPSASNVLETWLNVSLVVSQVLMVILSGSHDDGRLASRRVERIWSLRWRGVLSRYRLFCLIHPMCSERFSPSLNVLLMMACSVAVVPTMVCFSYAALTAFHAWLAVISSVMTYWRSGLM